MKQARIKVKITVPPPKYTEAFKKQIVREYESGLLNKEQLMKKYGIGGNSRVLDWN
jgi:transposase